MAKSHRGRKLVVAFSGDYKSQTAFDVPLATSDIDTRHPQTAPTFPGRTITREEIRDCTGEYVIKENITSRLTRLQFSFDGDARNLAGWLAFAQGSAAAPSGSQAAVVWTLTKTGTLTSGTFQVSHEFEGITDTADIPFDATTAEIQALFESLRTIKSGNVVVTGTDLPTGPVTITGYGKLAAGVIDIPTIDNTNLVGGTIAITEFAPGTSITELITRTTDDQTPLTSLIVGFDGDDTDPEKYKDIVVNSVTVRGALRGKVSIEIEVLGSADLISVPSYDIPDCINIDPIYTRDCRMRIGSDFQSENIREFSYTYSNNIFSGDDAFPYDDIDVVRLEHGDRTSSFTLSVYGSRGDDLFTLAEAETDEVVDLFVGPPVNRVQINAPVARVRLEDNPITFAGEALRSAMGILITPFFDQDTAGTPDNVIYYGPETVTFLDN